GQQNLHGAPNLCTELNTFAAQTVSMARKTNEDKYTARKPRSPVLRRTKIIATYRPHTRNESQIFGSRKYAAPYCSWAISDPANRPTVIPQKPSTSVVFAIWSIVSSGGSQFRKPGDRLLLSRRS